MLDKEERRNSRTQVIIAALNEEEGIGLTVAELMKTLDCPRILVVDGRSSDRTVEVAKNLGANVLLQDGLRRKDGAQRHFLSWQQVYCFYPQLAKRSSIRRSLNGATCSASRNF